MKTPMSRFERRRTCEEMQPFLDEATRVILRRDRPGVRVYVAGSYRRYLRWKPDKPLVGDLDLIVVGEELVDMKQLDPALSHVTAKKASGWVKVYGERVLVDAWLCPQESLGPFALFLTGPPQFNVRLRQVTNAAGLLLSQYGLFESVPAPTRSLPWRVKAGKRLDVPAPTHRIVDAEREFWRQWQELVKLPRPSVVPCPSMRDRWSPDGERSRVDW
jgi:hypothetical protein